MIQSYTRLFEHTSISGRQQYLAIHSADEPRIILPLLDKRIFRSALRIQNTAAPLNRLKKFMLGATYPLPAILLKSHIISDTPVLGELLRFLSGKVRWDLPLIVSGYCGSAGRNRKLTLQIMNQEGGILGFLKIGDTAGAQEFIRREYRACEIVERARLDSVEAPHSILLTNWDKWLVYCQSSIGERSASIGYDLNDSLVNALVELAEKTVEARGKNEFLESLAAKVDTYSAVLGGKVVDSVNRSISALRSVDFRLVLAHGDFVPYNIRRMDKRFAVYDWEYFDEKSLLFFDAFHFLFQGYSQIRKMAPGDIIRKKIFGHESNMDCIKKYADHFRIPHSAIQDFFCLYLAYAGILAIERSEANDVRQNHFLRGIEALGIRS